MAQQAQTNHGQTAIRTNYVYPGQDVTIFKPYTNQKITITGSNCSISDGQVLTWADWVAPRGRDKYAYNLSSSSVIHATVENAATDNKTGKNLTLHLTFSDFHFIDSKNQDRYSDPSLVDNHKTFLGFLIPAGSGVIAATTNNIATFKVAQSFTYENGSQYNGKSLMYVSSLDNYEPTQVQNPHAEFVHPESGVQSAFVPTNSKIGITQKTLHGNAADIVQTAYMMDHPMPGIVKDNSIIFLADPTSTYVMGIDNPQGGDVVASKPGGYMNNAFQAISFGANALQAIYPKTSQVHYHYNTE